MKENSSDRELVTVVSARTPAQAQLIASLLEGAGTPVYVAGSLLQDGWAMFQKLVGMLGVEVQVPRRNEAEAREVILAARAAPVGEEMSESELGGAALQTEPATELEEEKTF